MFDWRKMGEIHFDLAGSNMAPEAEAHLKMMKWWKGLNYMDQETFTKAQSTLGEGSFRWMASVPMSIWSLLLDIHPNIMQNPEELRKWLRANPQYCVPQASSGRRDR
jgi:hypothetical protein